MTNDLINMQGQLEILVRLHKECAEKAVNNISMSNFEGMRNLCSGSEKSMNAQISEPNTFILGTEPLRSNTLQPNITLVHIFESLTGSCWLSLT
jgi:hypothetical protein